MDCSPPPAPVINLVIREQVSRRVLTRRHRVCVFGELSSVQMSLNIPLQLGINSRAALEIEERDLESFPPVKKVRSQG